MNIQTEINEQHQAVITVELEKAQLDKKKQQAAKKLARNTHIPGFRPGKAPYNMVLRHVGEGRILEEAVETLIDEIYPKVIEESGVNPYGPGRLDDLKVEDTPQAKFIVPLAPKVTLGEYKNIRLDYEAPEMTDGKLDVAIKSMREMYAEIEKVERPAEVSDLVNITLTGKFTDAEEDEKPYIDNESYPVIIEPETADTANEWPFPGFSHKLIGLSEGETKSFTYTYPDDYEDEENEEGETIVLKGSTVNYEVTVIKVSSRSIPEVNEDFIKKFGDFESLEAFRDSTRKQMLDATKSDYEEKYSDQVLEELLKDAVIQYPPEAVEDEIDVVINRLKNRLENQEIGFDLYLRTRQTTEEALREELRPGAEARLKQTLALIEVAGQENITVSQDEVQKELEETLSMLLSSMDEKEARRSITNDVLRGLTANIFNNTLIRNTLKHLHAVARGEISDPVAASSNEEVPETPPTERSTEPEVETGSAEEPVSSDEKTEETTEDLTE